MENFNKEIEFNETTEEDVGIKEYINKKSEGFSSVLKHRYSDFLVNEIDMQENVVWLKQSENPNPTTNAKVPEEIESSKANLTCEEDVDHLVNEHFVSNGLITNENDINNLKQLLYKYVNNELNNDDRVTLDYIEDKNKRKLFHEVIRSTFDFLDSETLSDLHGGSSFMNTQKNKKEGWKNKKRDRREKEEPKIEQNEEQKPDVKKMVIFVNRNKTNFHKKRKVFADFNKKVLHFSMMKRNLDTVGAISYLARMLKRSNKTIKFAGNKDKRGITTQRVSAYSVMTEELLEQMKRSTWDRKIELSNFEFKDEELRLGLLKGNQFCVVFRFLEFKDKNFDEIKSNVDSSLESIGEKGFINYFGMQRFGVSSVPTHKVGLNCLKNNWKEAIICILHTQETKDAFRQLGLLKKVLNQDGKIDFSKFSEIFDNDSNINDLLKVLPRYSTEYRILNTMKKTGKNSYITAFKSLNRQLQLLYPHAYQSYIWNMSVSERIKNHGLNLLVGDIVKKKNSKENLESLFANEEEEENLDENEEKQEKEVVKNLDLDKIFEENYEYVTSENMKNYSFDDLYFPVIGFKVKLPKNETVNYITDLLKVDNIKIEDFATDSLNFNSTGYFRKIIERPKAIKFDLVYHDDPDVDLLSENYNITPHPTPLSVDKKYLSLRVQFQLPQSTYATMLFRELTKRSSAANYQNSLSKLAKK